ncbi:copper amine oxidase N-terminal domain-containing protein [Cohnella lupini]|nr:copper amine oxidase N-terminal domain-containing protein [Cohnella lupini]
MKRFAIALLSGILALSLAGTASAATVDVAVPTVKVALDGQTVDLGTNLSVKKGKTFVEYATLFKLLGYETEFEQETRTIHAFNDEYDIEASVGGDIAFVNGQTVYSTGEVIAENGRTWVGLRFAGDLTNHKVSWSGKTKSISLVFQGPTEEERAAVYELFNKMLLVEAADDKAGFAGLLSEDTAINAKEVEEDWDKTKTKTIIEDKYIESFSGSEAVVILVENTTKVSGEFFPDNRSQNRYTLHKEKDGAWRIYDVEAIAMEYTDIPGMFKQTVEIPDADKAAIGQVFADQMKAANEKNEDGYIATLLDYPGKEDLKTTLAEFFASTAMTVTTDEWTIVEYNGSDKATLLVSTTTEVDVDGTKSTVKSVILNAAEKVDGKWLLSADATVLENEQV